MDVRIDKVTRIMNFLGFKKVVSLIVKSGALYVIHTGNVGGLKGAFDHLNAVRPGAQLVASPIIKKFVEELKAGEERLEKESLEQLAQEGKNARLALSEIKDVQISYGKAHKMTVVAASGKFKFVFTHTDQAEVEKLVSMIKTQ